MKVISSDFANFLPFARTFSVMSKRSDDCGSNIYKKSNMIVLRSESASAGREKTRPERIPDPLDKFLSMLYNI